MDETNLATPDPNGMAMETRKIGIEGMSCQKCAQRIETALGKLRGVKEVHVDLEGGTATVVFDHREIHLPDLHDALLRAGYQPSAKPAE